MSYDEHLISQAGGDGDPTDRLAVIEAQIPQIPESEMSNTEKDRTFLLALVREQAAKLEAVCDVLYNAAAFGEDVNPADVLAAVRTGATK